MAGYCWDWLTKKDPQDWDIVLPAYGFRRRWNLTSYGNLWAVSAGAENEVGCIHTCQSLEFDFVGATIGPDLVVRDGKVVTDGFRRAKTDQSLRGLKTLFKAAQEDALRAAGRVIKNTHRTLMTRGQKGCFVFSENEETREHFRSLA